MRCSAAAVSLVLLVVVSVMFLVRWSSVSCVYVIHSCTGFNLCYMPVSPDAFCNGMACNVCFLGSKLCHKFFLHNACTSVSTYHNSVRLSHNCFIDCSSIRSSTREIYSNYSYVALWFWLSRVAAAMSAAGLAFMA
eukprot:scpid30804/ scgid10792/ 